MTVPCWWITLIVWSWVGVAAATDPPSGEARYWLQRMADANKTLDYQGTIVYVQGVHLEALRLTQRVEAQGTQQQIASLSGPKREMVITHSQATCTIVEKTPQAHCPPNRYKRSSSLLTGPRDLTRLEQHYTLRLLGTDRVADQEAVLIDIQPRDKLRFGYRLWLDQQTGILLRSMLLDEADNVVEQMMFTHLTVIRRIAPAASAADAPPSPARLQSTWQVVYLPAGFEPVRHNHFSVPNSDTDTAAERMTEHLLFSDGLASLSIFLERLAGAKPFLEGRSRMGAMNAFGAVVADHQVVVVGEVPQDTVQRIARSIRYVDPKNSSEDKSP